MANTTVYPFGTGGELPANIGIINDLTTGGVNKALSAEMGKSIGQELYGHSSGSEAITVTWRQGTLGDTYHEYYSGNSKRIICAFACNGDITILVGSGYYASVHAYSIKYTDINQITSNDTGWLGNISAGWLEAGEHTITNPGTALSYAIVVKKGSAGTTDVAPSEGTSAVTSIIGTFIGGGLVAKVDALTQDTGSYVWGPDMVKRQVKTEMLGTLAYLQAFCKYDGKYYSTNGTNIAEQDASFSTLRNVSISVGHGNSLQLVSGGKAWVSGWDDQKMYKVDLSTLTVESTVTLPTTGYTTAAVDEANGIMYIFQRGTYPSTIDAYNFIVYDYVNQQVKSTRVIESFAAMQSVDFFQGKIFMLFGLGTIAAPSGMRVYNTAGDVLSTFDLSLFASREPEGICVDRDTLDLLVSDLSKNLYSIVSK